MERQVGGGAGGTRIDPSVHIDVELVTSFLLLTPNNHLLPLSRLPPSPFSSRLSSGRLPFSLTLFSSPSRGQHSCTRSLVVGACAYHRLPCLYRPRPSYRSPSSPFLSLSPTLRLLARSQCSPWQLSTSATRRSTPILLLHARLVRPLSLMLICPLSCPLRFIQQQHHCEWVSHSGHYGPLCL